MAGVTLERDVCLKTVFTWPDIGNGVMKGGVGLS